MGCKKSYVDKKGTAGKADRFVAQQPWVIKEDGENIIFNLRKMNELPYHLTLAEMVDALKEHTLLNFTFIYEKMRGIGIDRCVE